MAGKRESEFQRKLKKDLKKMFPGCFVMKLDANQIQGIPDLIVLYKDKWATLECKRDIRSKKNPRPNQSHYVDVMDQMSFSRFIYPENREEVLHELQRTFEA